MSIKMTPKNTFRALTIGLVLSLGLCGLGMRYLLAHIHDLSQEISVNKAMLQVLEDKNAMTIATEAQMARLQFIQTIADQVVPAEKTQPELVTQLIQIANENSISLESILFNKKTETGKPTEEGGTTIPDITQAEPLPNVTGVFSLPLTITVSGSYDNMLNMLRDIEQNRRKMQVSSVSISPLVDTATGTTGQGVSATILIDVYVRP